MYITLLKEYCGFTILFVKVYIASLNASLYGQQNYSLNFIYSSHFLCLWFILDTTHMCYFEIQYCEKVMVTLGTGF